LRIELRLPAGLREGELTFRPAGPALWQARRAGWQVALRRVDAAALCWQFGLIRLDSPDPALPLAAAASLDAALCLARRLLPGMTEPDLRGLLDCDLAFPLASLGAGEHGIDALAEGGYALRGPEGCHAIAPVQAEALLLRGGTVAVA
jgi:hypothetical protein